MILQNRNRIISLQGFGGYGKSVIVHEALRILVEKKYFQSLILYPKLNMISDFSKIACLLITELQETLRESMLFDEILNAKNHKQSTELFREMLQKV